MTKKSARAFDRIGELKSSTNAEKFGFYSFFCITNADPTVANEKQ